MRASGNEGNLADGVDRAKFGSISLRRDVAATWSLIENYCERSANPEAIAHQAVVYQSAYSG